MGQGNLGLLVVASFSVAKAILDIVIKLPLQPWYTIDQFMTTL